MLTDLGWIGLGLALLYFGAEGLVGGSSRLAMRFGVSPLVVGLTVVAYGTSAPELVVSVKAAWLGQGSLAVGNVVGSNIMNIACILGLCSLIEPARADSRIVRREIPVMIGVTAVGTVLLWDGALRRWEAVVLLTGAVAYTVWTLSDARRQKADPLAGEFAEELPAPSGSVGRDVVFIAGGLALLIAGGHFFVDGAQGVARRLGVSEAVIGLTIVAAGTSLPELATSLLAAWRKENAIAVGNVVGSNVFNLLGILGLSGVLRPIGEAGMAATDLLVMLGVAVLLLPLMRTGLRVSRPEGALLLAGYIGYVVYLWAQST